VPEPRLGLNPNDLARRGLAPGDLARVESRRGSVHVIVEADDGVRSGQAYLPMHWGKRFLGGRGSAGTNTLTIGAFDPFSRQPELKHAAIKVSPAELGWRLVAFAEALPERATEMLDALQALQDEVAFATSVMIGRERPGVLMRAGNENAPGASWLAALDEILGVNADDTLRYEDARLAQSRRLRIADDRLVAVRLCGSAGAVTSGEWLRDWLVECRAVAEIRRLLLSPATHAPAGFVLSGRVVCQCWNVSERDIASALAECAGGTDEKLATLKASLKCGTNCGSCLPELRVLAA
jgi:assimilatory nitrate reductase catalytic subunit